VDGNTDGAKKTRAKRAAPGETPHQRFERLAEARTSLVVDKIRALGRLSNPTYYEYSPSDVAVIFDAISEELEKARKKFLSPDIQKKSFEFRDRKQGPK